MTQTLNELAQSSTCVIPQSLAKSDPFEFEWQAQAMAEALTKQPKLRLSGKAHGDPVGTLIDLSFLSMLSPDGWPRFAVYSIRDKNCEIGVRMDCRGTGRFGLTGKSGPIGSTGIQRVANHYRSTLMRLAREAASTAVVNISHDDVRCWISTKFSGVIPNEVRDEIRRVMKDFDDVLIVAEADHWEFNQQVVRRPLDLDPLVIGVKGSNFYLIRAFDMTAIEQYVSREFSTNQKEAAGAE